MAIVRGVPNFRIFTVYAASVQRHLITTQDFQNTDFA